MKKLSTYLTIAFALTFAFWASDAMAFTSSAAFSVALQKVIDAFTNSKVIIFIVGGFGLIALAFLAIFGKVNWKWFASLLIGLAVVAAAGMVVDYATGSGAGTNMADTFQASIGM